MGMERLLRAMRTELVRKLEEERKKRKEFYWIRARIPGLPSGLKGSLERRPRVM
jgi:hypothetical protein